ncbi:hypothetical protein Tco_1474321 [Tanacetum coccineum]
MTGVGRNTNQEFTGCDTPYEHTFEEPSPVHQHNSPPQDQAQGQMAMDDLLLVVPQLISRIDSLETDLKPTKLTMGNAIIQKKKNPEATGRKSQDDPSRFFGTKGLGYPSYKKGRCSREEQVEDISPNTLEAAKTLSRKKVDTGAEQVNTAEGVNTGSIKLSTISEQLSTGSDPRSTYKAKICKEKWLDLVNQKGRTILQRKRERAKRNNPYPIIAEDLYDELLEESRNMEVISAEEIEF